MKAIIDNKLYDTDKAEMTYEYTEAESCAANIKIYKTSKDNYFQEISVFASNTLNTLSVDQVKEVLSKRAPDKYIELFGEVEEA